MIRLRGRWSGYEEKLARLSHDVDLPPARLDGEGAADRALTGPVVTWMIDN
jgi:hypothetical protein